MRAEAAADRASRAFGALIYSAMGAIWLLIWCRFAQPDAPLSYVIVAIAAALLMAFAWRVYRRNLAAAPQGEESPEQRRASRAFTWVNVAQGIAILVGINVLNNLGLGRWDIPWAILVVGLHFLALLPVLHRGSHAVIGGALIALAAGYPWLAAGGPDNPVGLLGAGLILWLSALWALKAALSPELPGSG